MDLTHVQKLQIIRSIDNEKLLREELLIPVFQQMNSYEQIHHTHGADEKGKDIVLVGRDELGDFVYTAVIVKCKDISNATSGKARELTANVCTQIAATINSGFSCTLQNRHVDFNRIMVVTNGNISQGARDEMVKFAETHRFTKVLFRSGDDLVRWVDKHLPEYYMGAGGRTSAYLGRLRAKCDKLDELKNITIYKGDVRRILDVFVSPTLFRVNRVISDNDVAEAKHITGKLERVIHESGNVLVVGGPGSGKSTLIRAQVQRLLDLNGPAKGLNVPVLLRGADLLKYAGETLEDIINTHVRTEMDVPDFDICRYLANEHRSASVYVFIDGLEEITSQGHREKVQGLLNRFAQKYPKHKLVLSSRDTSELDLWAITTVKRWTITELRTKEIRDFIAKWFRTGTDESHPLMKALQDHDLLTKLPKTPLVITLLAILFDHDTNSEVPANLAELYQMFVDLLLGKWSLDRRLDTFFDANIREYVMSAVAEHMHDRGLVTLRLTDFHQIIRGCSSYIGLPLDVDEMRSDLLDHTSLLVLNENGEVEFRHLSFQEFLVAKKYDSEANDDLEINLRTKFADEWWAPVAYYYCGLRRRNERLLQGLSLDVSKYEPISALKAAWTFGYLVQSSYLTGFDCRLESVEAFVLDYSRRIEFVLTEESALPAFEVVPPGLFLISFVQAFKLHYASRFMEGLYSKLYDRLKERNGGFSESLAQLIVASILATNGSPDQLLDTYDRVKGEPILNLALNLEIELLLDSDAASQRMRSEVKKVSTRIRRQLREGSRAYKALIQDKQLSPIRQVAAADMDGESTNSEPGKPPIGI